MNFAKQSLFLYFILLIYTQSCRPGIGSDVGVKGSAKIAQGLVAFSSKLTELGDAVATAGTSIKDGMMNHGMTTLLEGKKMLIALGSVGAGAAKAIYVYGGTVVVAHPYVAGATGVAGLCFGGYRYYRSDLAERTALALKQSEIDFNKSAMQIAEENARIAREVMEREIRIKEEVAKTTLEIMQKTAKIRNVLIITAAATTASIGIGYAGYRFYRSIQEHNHQERAEQKLLQHESDLSLAKQTLLETIVQNAEHEIGVFRLPEGCGRAASSLLALPGGQQVFEEITRAAQNQRAPAALLS